MKKYEFFEHTADIGVRIFGKDLKQLLSNSVEALVGLLISSQPDCSVNRTIELEAENVEELIVDFLNEIIFLFYTYGFIPIRWNVDIKNESHASFLSASLSGGKIDFNKIRPLTEIKAATYHNLKVKEESGILHLEVIFDV